MVYDVTMLKERTDLLALIGNDVALQRVASTHGGEWAGPCPFCGGHDRFRVWPEQDGGRFWCRQCEMQGDAIAYVQRRDGITFAEACERLGGQKAAPSASVSRNVQKCPAPEHLFPETEPPSAVWQARAREFVAYAQGQLWQRPDALAYLHDRGLSDDTIREAGLGYYDGLDRDKNVRRWGVQGSYVWLPRGWVIPCESGGGLWYVKIRRHPDDLGPDDAKYQTLKGGHLTMYGLDTLAREHYSDVVICEGELDALLLRQHVGCVCGCVALGSASKGLDMQAVSELVTVRRVWVALDADKAGQEGARKLLAASARIHPLAVPAHDVTDAWREGHDLVAWVVPRIGERTPERRRMWLTYHLDRLGDRADDDDDLWRVWQALLSEYNELRVQCP